jgi:aminomethyltransferase
LRKTHLFSYHVEHAKMIEFAGFNLPLYYSSIVSEHLAVRESVGVFDVSHMCRLLVRGRDATALLERLVPSDISGLKDGRAKYTVFCNESGGVVDDTIVLKVESDEYIVVGNAANREKDLNWMLKHSTELDVQIDDISDNTALISVQGPKAAEIIKKVAALEVERLQRFSHTRAEVAGHQAIVSRTGYTGEDGFEILLPECSVDAPDKALEVWGEMISSGAQPCGLGARDTLRLEAGLCLYGQDIDDGTTPIEAALTWLVKSGKTGYIGYETIVQQMRMGVSKLRVCFIVSDGIARRGYNLIHQGKKVGVVTSGTYSPILKKGIGMGYVDARYAETETELDVDIRGRLCRAVVKKPPLYDTTKYGWGRRHSSVG